METEKLKPCPFCGGDELAVYPRDLSQFGSGMPHPGADAQYVRCDGCGADGPQSFYAHEAMERWNRRTPDPAVNVGAVKALEWEGSEYTGWSAYGVGLSYSVDDESSDEECFILAKHEGASTLKSAHPSLDKAQSAAQADYERRILSALTPPQSGKAGGAETPAEQDPAPSTDVAVLYVSEKQLDQCIGTYLPTRKEREGNFQLPLYRHPLPQPNVTMLLQSKADTIRKEYQLAYGRPCDCSTTEGALQYGRAQGLEIAADIISAEGSADAK